MNLTLTKRYLLASTLVIFGLLNLNYAQNVGDAVLDYGFEDGVDSLGVPTGCVLGPNDYNGNAEFILDETVAHTGSASGLIQGVDANELSLDAFLPNVDLVEEGATYTYSVWLKTELTDGVYAVQITPQWDYYEYDTKVTDWTEYTGEFVGGEDGLTSVVIGLYGKGKIWVDDCKIVLTDKVYDIGDTVFTAGFEAGADTSGLPIGTEGPWDWNSNGSVAEISTDAHTGNYSATITNPDTDLDIDCSLDVPVSENEKNAEYELTVWIKTELTEGDAQIITAWDNARLITDITGSTDWTQYTLNYVGPNTDPAIRLHINHGKGQVWYDDIVITKTKNAIEVPTDAVANPGFEIPNEDGTAPIFWFTTNWGSGSQEVGFDGNDTARYIWDNNVFHSGGYSACIQITQADIEKTYIDAGWMTNNLEFISGGFYELSYWIKTENFETDPDSILYKAYISIGYNNLNLTQISTDTDWIEVKDTILFPTDQDENGWRNDMRFRYGSWGDPPKIGAKVWFDDVKFTLIGMQANQLDSVTVSKGEENSVNISWPSHPDVSNPVYHVLMQPLNEKGVFENNLLSNPGFEEPNDDGSAPKDWTFRPDGWGAEPIGEFPAAETYDGNFSVYFGELDPSDETGVYGRWQQVFDNSSMKRHEAYMYGAMVKYQDVVALQDSIIDDNHPDGYYFSCGVNIWYDRYGFQFQNAGLIDLGWSTPTGTSDGWVQIGLPLIYDQAATRHNVGFGLGQYWEGLAKGSMYIDNAFVVPFDEVATTSENSITINDVPEGVKYFAVYTEDASGEFIVSPAKVGLVKTATDVTDNSVVPAKFELKQNYPNPFNPSTRIEYSIPTAGQVKLVVYDILGRVVTELVNVKNQPAGNHTVEFNASQLTSGVYFYRITSPGHVMTKKMMLLK
ncbi:MAG: T9SS type A sorting domain-containing protein [Bacteroidota bacterium]